MFQRDAVCRSDDKPFWARTFSWHDPVHYWKAGPGVIMTVEKQNINLSPLKFGFNMVMM